MAFPNFREDFEGSLSLPTTVIAPNNLWEVLGASGFTGTNSVTMTGVTDTTLYTSAMDSLGGNLTASVYFKPFFGGFQQYFSARNQSLVTVERNFCSGYYVGFTQNGIEINLISGVKTVLMPPGNTSVANLLAGSGYCWEFRLSNSGLSSSIIRTSDGASFTSGTSLAGGWTVVNPPKTYKAYDANYINASGYIAIEQQAANLGSQMAWDDLMYESSFPTIDISGVTLSNTGLTQTLTAGGFTDPLFGTKWFTSNSAVATVSNTVGNTGIVTSVGFGTAIISVSGKRDTTQFATALVTVVLNQSVSTIVFGGTASQVYFAGFS